MKIIKSVKEQKGILVSDAVVAILVILLFSGTLVAIITNIMSTSAEIKIQNSQTYFVTNIFEYAEKLPYSDTTEENLIQYANSKFTKNAIIGSDMTNLLSEDKLYKVAIDVQKYNETTGNEDKLDIIKIISVEVRTTVEGKEHSTQMKMVKKANSDELESLLNE